MGQKPFKKVAVTGASGLLGSTLVQMLANHGYEVVSLTRTAENITGCDALVNCAGKVGYAEEDRHAIYSANYHFTKFILQEARRAGIKRFVQVSSIVTFGHGPTPRNESASFNAKELNLPYWTSKYEAEALALSQNQASFEVLSVNPGTILGGSPEKSMFTHSVRLMARTPFLITPLGGSDFVSCTDVAKGCILALEKGRAGERYILGSENLSYLELYKRVRNVCGKKAAGIEIPFGLLDFFSKNPRVRRMNGIYLFHSIEKARAELGYQPESIDNSIRELL